MGDPNASIPTPQPVHYRPMFGSYGRARTGTSLTFVSATLFATGYDLARKLKVQKRLVMAVEELHKVKKRDLVHNGATPKIEVDPETYKVTADGEWLVCEPADRLPMAQRYFLF